jgi:ketosteroid isomerase-like protein
MRFISIRAGPFSLSTRQTGSTPKVSACPLMNLTSAPVAGGVRGRNKPDAAFRISPVSRRSSATSRFSALICSFSSSAAFDLQQSSGFGCGVSMLPLRDCPVPDRTGELRERPHPLQDGNERVRGKHGDDYTLMPPYGGEPRCGFDAEEALEATPKMFRAGEADLELVQSHASGDMAVLVAIERQHGEVGGMPDQDWSLRVTLVFRREGPDWRLVHRHADPLVHTISMEHMAALARGQG